MPVLAKEPDLYPPDIFETWVHDEDQRQWFVLYTRSRREKVVARHLLARQIPFYLPTVRRTLAYGPQRIESYVALFPGYVFLFGSHEERLSSLTTNAVSRVLPVEAPEQLAADLQRIQQLILSEAPLTVESRLAPGNRVRIRSGPLTGIEGTVVCRRGQTRLVVSVNFIQQGASVELSDYLLEPAA
jgi:transcriptional antiterminator RfaH